MFSRDAMAVIVGVLVGAAGALVAVKWATADRPAYQLQVSEWANTMLLLETDSGRLWAWRPTARTNRWQKIPSPPR